MSARGVRMNKRTVMVLGALLGIALVAGVVLWLFPPPPNRSMGRTLFGVGGPGGFLTREVRFTVDGPGTIAPRATSATLTFSEGKLVIDPTGAILNDQELIKLANDVKLVEI